MSPIEVLVCTTCALFILRSALRLIAPWKVSDNLSSNIRLFKFHFDQTNFAILNLLSENSKIPDAITSSRIFLPSPKSLN